MTVITENSDKKPVIKPPKKPNTAKSKANPFVIIIGLSLICWCIYIIFFKESHIDTFKQVFISILLCLGCGLVSTALSGNFKVGGVLSVTGSVGITCYFLFTLMGKIQLPSDNDKNFYQSFVEYSGIDIKLKVLDSLNKPLIDITDPSKLTPYIKQLNYSYKTRDLTYEFVIDDSIVSKKANQLLVFIPKSVYNRIIDSSNIAHYNHDIWGNERLPEYPDDVILTAPFSTNTILTITLMK